MIRSKFLLISFLLALSVTLLPAAARADQDTGKFAFYYQRIVEVIPLEPATPPQGFWEKTKALVNKGWNFVKKYTEIGIRRCLFPGEGEKMWYSLNNNKYAYKMQRTKVRDEKHLLELMGAADGDLSKLTNGQKALLEVYRNATNSTLKDLSKKALPPRIIVHLSDTTGFEDSSKYPQVRDDFWPMSMGLNINMPTSNYNYAGSEKKAVRTMVHETAHCTNLTFPNYKGYGPDGHHFSSELTAPRSAFQEAWSEYQEMLFDPDLAKSWATSYQTIQIEDRKIAGKYESVPFSDAKINAGNLFSIEAVNAWLLYRLSTEIPNGKEKVEKAFYKGNVPWENMARYLKTFVKMYPADAAAVQSILSNVGEGKLSPAAIADITGVPATGLSASAPDGATPAAAPAEPTPSAALSRSAESATSSGASLAELQKRYELAYREYVQAAQKQAPDMDTLRQALDKARAALLPALQKAKKTLQKITAP
jgi:hypothetical protein